jgi:hypothetical protein
VLPRERTNRFNFGRRSAEEVDDQGAQHGFVGTLRLPQQRLNQFHRPAAPVTPEEIDPIRGQLRRSFLAADNPNQAVLGGCDLDRIVPCSFPFEVGDGG